MLRFSDGVNIDTSGPLRAICLSDGWYVVGEGMLMPENSREDALETIQELKGEKNEYIRAAHTKET